MSSVVISGDSSGTITLSAPAVAGTNTITLPAATGTAVITGTTPTLNGITFPATQVPSADANTLDDYEEGTFTPAAVFSGTTGSPTYTQQLGYYIKIGRLVTVKVRLSFNKNTLSGGFYTQISGLPYSSENISSSYFVSTSSWYNPSGTGFINANLLINPNSSIIEVFRLVAANTDGYASAIPVSEIGTSFNHYITIAYFSAS